MKGDKRKQVDKRDSGAKYKKSKSNNFPALDAGTKKKNVDDQIKETSKTFNNRPALGKTKGLNINENKGQKKSFKEKKWKKGTSKIDGKTSSSPPNWSEFKKKKKELRVSRKQSKVDSSIVDIVAKAKQISEKLRRKKNSADQEKLVELLHSTLKGGSYVKLALAHDTSRIIQWLLKCSPPKTRTEITKELIPIVSQMVQSKYARNCVKKMMKYGSPEIHNDIIASFYGHVVNLASHTFSAPLIDMAYTEYANEKQKCHLQQEFYGDIYKNSKDDSVHKLTDTYKDSPEMKNAILNATKGNLERILNKEVHDNALMHAVLYNYLSACSTDERSEMLASLSSNVAPLSNSKYGVKVAIMCVQYGTNKDKKTILKVIKEHAISLSTHEHGHLLLLAVFSSVDDTVLVKKALLSVLLDSVRDIVKEEWGRKTMLWLVAPGDRKHFHPSFLNWLQEGVSSGSSKKDPELRRAELLEAILPVLCKSIEEDPLFWLANGSIGVLCIAVLKAATGDNLKSALNSVCKLLCKVDWIIKEGEDLNGIEHPAMHACLKKLAQDDKHRLESGNSTFGEELIQVITSETISHWLNFNRGCFLLVCVFENNNLSVQASLVKLLSGQKNNLKKKTFAGAKILLKKLTESGTPAKTSE